MKKNITHEFEKENNMNKNNKGVALSAKPEQRLLRVEISKGITQKDAIRILEKINLAIGDNETSWDTELNNFVVLLEEETDSDDGICVAKQITWRDIKRKKDERLFSFNSLPMGD